MAASNGSYLGPNALVLALLGALGVGLPALRFTGGLPVNAAATPAPSVAPTRTTASYSHGALELLEQFFDTAAPQQTRDKPWLTQDQPGLGNESLPESDREKRFLISFLIETVPASDSASLRHEFDTYLNAIQMAAGRAGYVLDSFDLPWLGQKDHSGGFHLEEPIELDLHEAAAPQVSGAGKGNSPTRPGQAENQSNHPDPIVAVRPATNEAKAGRDPGVLLFRGNGKLNRLLIVFLVDETPTRGVNKTALRDALDQIAWLSGWISSGAPAPQYLVNATCSANRAAVERVAATPCPAEHREIRIIGPTFSGSAVSLRNSLIAWLGAHSIGQVKFSILSGTATAIGDKLGSTQVGDPSLEFHSVRIADSAIWQFVHGFLHAGDDEAHPTLAVLSDDTSYGGAATGQKSAILRISYPVHISNLRAALDRTDLASPPPALELHRRDIPMTDEGDQPDKDVIPLFSGRSATYDELVLENLLTTLNTERIKYIGIVATDVEDLVFLAHEIRRTCPNAVLFTTSADLRYVHTDVNADLIGMFVFSTYPLFGLNQAWTYPFTGASQRILFPGEDAQGVFNATLAQLNDVEGMEEYGAPFATNLRSYNRTPALWVGVVGRDAIWPLRFQMEEGVENLYAPRTFRTGTPAMELLNFYPLPFQIAFLVICLGSLIPAAAMLWPELFKVRPMPPGSGRPWPEALFGDAVFPEFHQERWMRVSAFLGALLIALTVGVGYFLLPLCSAGLFGGLAHTMSLSLPVALATILAMLVTIPATLAAITASLRRIWNEPPKTDRGAEPLASLTPTGAQFALFGTAVGFVLVAAFAISQWLQAPGVTLLNFIRASNLGNGVSPLTPLIFLGTANLCLIGGDLWRLRLIEDCRVKSPFLNFEAGAPSFGGTDALEARVIHFLECSPWELPGTWLLIALLTVSFIYFACSRGLPVASIDGWSFNLLFFLSAGFIYFYFSIQLLRFGWLWHALHRLLRRLYWHPTRGAYSLLRVRSLPESDTQTIRLIEPRPSLTATEFCLQCAREILYLLDHPAGQDGNEERTWGGPETAETLRNSVRFAEGEIAAVLAAQRRPNWQAATMLRLRAQEAMAHLSQQLTKLLEPAWRLVPDRPQPGRAERDQKVIEWGNLFVAGRVVDFLRQAFPQMRILGGSAMAGLLAMMLAASVYPFVQRDLLLWISWFVLLTAVGIGLTIFVQIGRSRIISMLYGTTPGRFNWDSAFTMRLLLFGIIPILTLLGAQYPNALGGVVSWIGRLVGGAPGH